MKYIKEKGTNTFLQYNNNRRVLKNYMKIKIFIGATTDNVEKSWASGPRYTMT